MNQKLTMLQITVNLDQMSLLIMLLKSYQLHEIPLVQKKLNYIFIFYHHLKIIQEKLLGT
jgi:hypothetical protein